MTKVDRTDPFTVAVAKKRLKTIKQWSPSKRHSRLVDAPPTHVLYKGQIALVVSHISGHLWAVTMYGKPTMLHELDCQFLSKDWQQHPPT